MIIGTRISTDRFDYNEQAKQFTTEISVLASYVLNALGRLYDDACDQGFVLVWSGKEIPCYLASVDTNDGDIAGWHFKPVSPRHDFSVLVIND